MTWFVSIAAISTPWIVLGAAVLWLRRKRYVAFLGYDPGLPGHLDGGVDALPLVVRRGAVAIPTSKRPVTVFLAVEVSSSWLGRFDDPHVIVRGENHAQRQYFERGARGRRYLNLDPVLPADLSAGSTLEITTRRCRIATEVQLLRFPRADVEEPIVALAPHPDDAELSSFGVWADRDSWVATISAGEIGTTSYGGLFPETRAGSRLRGRTRVVESLTAPAVGGVAPERVTNLGYFDGTLEAMALNPTTPMVSHQADAVLADFRAGASFLPGRETATWQGLVDDLCTLVSEAQPKTLLAPHPLLDHHPDHRFTGLATLEAVARSIDLLPTGGQLLLYVVHPPITEGAVGLHPVGRRDGTVSVPPGRLEDDWFESILSLDLSEDLLRRKALAVDTYRDLREEPCFAIGDDLRGRVVRGLRDIYRALAVYDASLFRRHLRPNELFFTVPFSRAPEFHSRFRSRLLGD